MMTDAHWELLAKYLANECSIEEREQVKALLDEEDNEKIITQAIAIFEASVLNELSAKDSFHRLTRRLTDDKLL